MDQTPLELFRIYAINLKERELRMPVLPLREEEVLLNIILYLKIGVDLLLQMQGVHVEPLENKTTTHLNSILKSLICDTQF